MGSHHDPGLYIRQPGGGFYARITLNGKRSWRSLKTDKLRTAQGLLRDLQSGHTRQVSTRSDDKLHAAMAAVIEFRSIRRALKSRQLRKSTIAYHGEILATAKKLLPDRPLATFDTVGLLRAIQTCGLSQSRRKACKQIPGCWPMRNPDRTHDRVRRVARNGPWCSHA